MIKKTDLLNAICIVILFIFLGAYLFKVIEIQNTFIESGWITGDWLINYSGGFVRRGLLGEFFLRASSALEINPQNLVLALKIIFYLMFCISLFLLALKKGFGVLELVLFLAPWSIIFDLNDPNGSGRKELLLISLFTLYILLYTLSKDDSEQFYKNWNFWFLLLALPFLTLTHEGLFFFYQYFLLLPLISKNLYKKDIIIFGIPYLISAVILLVLGFLYSGDQAVAEKICQELVDRGIDRTICGGAISSIGGFNFSIHEGYYRIYLPIALLTIVPLVAYGLHISKVNSKKFFIIFFVLLIPTIPLYTLGADWGRWIHLTGILIFISLIAAKDSSVFKAAKNHLVFKILLLIIVFLYTFNWKIPHWIGDGKSLTLLKQNFSKYISGFKLNR